jgi:hypothetical protein
MKHAIHSREPTGRRKGHGSLNLSKRHHEPRPMPGGAHKLYHGMPQSSWREDTVEGASPYDTIEDQAGKFDAEAKNRRPDPSFKDYPDNVEAGFFKGLPGDIGSLNSPSLGGYNWGGRD